MRATGAIAGLYGKLPSQGDFLNRGVPAAVEGAWTRWLDRCLASAKETLGSYWLPTYLSSPPWRFALEPDLIGPTGFIGVIASSVDKLGRAYPFAGLMALEPGARLGDLDGTSEGPFPELETIVLEAIDGAIDADLAAARIAALAPYLPALADPASADGALRSPDPLEETFVMLGQSMPSIAAMLARATRGEDPGPGSAGWSCWWQNGWAGMAPMTVVSRGLPPPRAFLGFLDGQWAEHGFAPPPGGRRA